MPVWAWVLLGVFLLLWVALGAGIWPFANCRRCQGKGRWHSPSPPQSLRERWTTGEVRDKWIWCSVCRGTGRRLAWKPYR